MDEIVVSWALLEISKREEDISTRGLLGIVRGYNAAGVAFSGSVNI